MFGLFSKAAIVSHPTSATPAPRAFVRALTPSMQDTMAYAQLRMSADYSYTQPARRTYCHGADASLQQARISTFITKRMKEEKGSAHYLGLFDRHGPLLAVCRIGPSVGTQLKPNSTMSAIYELIAPEALADNSGEIFPRTHSASSRFEELYTGLNKLTEASEEILPYTAEAEVPLVGEPKSYLPLPHDQRPSERLLTILTQDYKFAIHLLAEDTAFLSRRI